MTLLPNQIITMMLLEQLLAFSGPAKWDLSKQCLKYLTLGNFHKENHYMALDHYICLDTLEIIVLNQTEQIQI